MTARLRPARPTDAGAVGAILSGFAEETEWMPRLHNRAQDIGFAGQMIERGWVTLAEVDGAVQGFLAREGDAVHALYLAPEARGRGIGARLLRDAQAERHRLSLWTFQANRGARRFYARHGFAEVECTDGAGNDEGLPDIRMVWESAGREGEGAGEHVT